MNTMVMIAVCEKRTDKRYRNQRWTWNDLKEKNRQVYRTTVSLAEYSSLPKAKKDELKDHGGFVGGFLQDGKRNTGSVMGRQVGCLDADNIPGGVDFISLVRKALPDTEWFLYSTHKHTATAPRYRVVILFDREVSETEYPAILRQVANDIGMDYFDDTTYEATRMMYWSSCPKDAEFVFEENSGEALKTGEYLARYADWRDPMSWPTSSRQGTIIQNEIKKQGDPLLKEGIIGAFCRTYYPIQNAIKTFLSDVYSPTEKDRRWSYIPAESTAGVVIYDDRFAYSHHATDPANGQLLNAYDLVRIHRFPDDNPRESASRMNEFAKDLDEVKILLDRERQEKALPGVQVHTADPAACRPAGGKLGEETQAARNWVTQLRYKPKSSEIDNDTTNLMTIFRNEPRLQGFAKNEMADRIQIIGELPWTKGEKRFWTDDDSAQMKVWIDMNYTDFPYNRFETCFTAIAKERIFHPIRDYLKGLPAWDGVARIETLFQNCLQAEDTPYVRAVARKTFAAAVTRIFKPAAKFDSVLVLDGAQGIGKSTLFQELCGEDFYNETLTLTDISDKSGAEKLQGKWIVEIGELAGMRKADVEKVKAFLSTRNDDYRPSYGKTVEKHPRQCIIIATVNGERGYLRDITGNRRFWIVKCHQTDQKKNFSFSDADRDQIWAEAIAICKKGEKLYLENELLKEAEKVQRISMEEDDRQGMVEEYLETLLPENWDRMDVFDRQRYMRNPEKQNGTNRRTTVSNIEIWTECFGNDPNKFEPGESRKITPILIRIGGWEKYKTERLRIYGPQRMWKRAESVT